MGIQNKSRNVNVIKNPLYNQRKKIEFIILFNVTEKKTKKYFFIKQKVNGTCVSSKEPSEITNMIHECKYYVFIFCFRFFLFVIQHIT